MCSSDLYVACHICNGKKAHHLIPPYIFDPRFSPFYNIFDARKGVKPHFEEADGKCRISVPAATISPKKISAEHYSSYILNATLDLMEQNRYEGGENDSSSLILLRGVVWKTCIDKLHKNNWTDEELLRKYQSMKNSSEYPDFISLITFLFAKQIERRKGLKDEFIRRGLLS